MAYQHFEVGELVITQHATYFSEYDGALGVVTAPLATRLCLDLHSMERTWARVYRVKLLVKDSLYLSYRPWQLRKLGSGETSSSRVTARQAERDSARRKEKALT